MINERKTRVTRRDRIHAWKSAILWSNCLTFIHNTTTLTLFALFLRARLRWNITPFNPPSKSHYSHIPQIQTDTTVRYSILLPLLLRVYHPRTRQFHPKTARLTHGSAEASPLLLSLYYQLIWAGGLSLFAQFGLDPGVVSFELYCQSQVGASLGGS